MNLPTFNLGTPKQRSAAAYLRQAYINKLLERGFDKDDLQQFITVRCVAKWWLDNKDKLGVMDASKHFRSATRLVTKHGSAEDAAEAIIDSAYEQEKKTAEYVYNSTPMFKL